MAEMISNVITFLIESDVALYLAVIGDVIFSIFNAKATKKLKASAPAETVVTKDIQSLIEYHEKVAQELKKKVG